jgi:hypothetical protein
MWPDFTPWLMYVVTPPGSLFAQSTPNLPGEG